MIDILCTQPVCVQFMAWKFLRYFVCDEPSPAWRQAVADALAGEKMATGPMLRRLFRSAAFYEERHQQIKAPNLLRFSGSKITPNFLLFLALTALYHIVKRKMAQDTRENVVLCKHLEIRTLRKKMAGRA